MSGHTSYIVLPHQPVDSSSQQEINRDVYCTLECRERGREGGREGGESKEEKQSIYDREEFSYLTDVLFQADGLLLATVPMMVLLISGPVREN